MTHNNPDRPGLEQLQRLERVETLADALRRSGDDLDATALPPTLWTTLSQRVSARHKAEPIAVTPLPSSNAGTLRWRGSAVWAALASAVLLVLSTALLLTSAATSPDSVERIASARGAELPFVPVAGAEAWPAPGGGAAAWLIRAELPRERLAEFGLPFEPSRAGERVEAQLLLRDNGQVLAVRVLAAVATQ